MASLVTTEVCVESDLRRLTCKALRTIKHHLDNAMENMKSLRERPSSNKASCETLVDETWNWQISMATGSLNRAIDILLSFCSRLTLSVKSGEESFLNDRYLSYDGSLTTIYEALDEEDERKTGLSSTNVYAPSTQQTIDDVILKRDKGLKCCLNEYLPEKHLHHEVLPCSIDRPISDLSAFVSSADVTEDTNCTTDVSASLSLSPGFSKYESNLFKNNLMEQECELGKVISEDAILLLSSVNSDALSDSSYVFIGDSFPLSKRQLPQYQESRQGTDECSTNECTQEDQLLNLESQRLMSYMQQHSPPLFSASTSMTPIESVSEEADIDAKYDMPCLPSAYNSANAYHHENLLERSTQCKNFGGPESSQKKLACPDFSQATACILQEEKKNSSLSVVAEKATSKGMEGHQKETTEEAAEIKQVGRKSDEVPKTIKLNQLQSDDYQCLVDAASKVAVQPCDMTKSHYEETITRLSKICSSIPKKISVQDHYSIPEYCLGIDRKTSAKHEDQFICGNVELPLVLDKNEKGCRLISCRKGEKSRTVEIYGNGEKRKEKSCDIVSKRNLCRRTRLVCLSPNKKHF